MWAVPLASRRPHEVDFADALKGWRRGRRMTQAEVGAAIDRSANAVRSWEAGRSRPSLDVLQRLVQRFPDAQALLAPDSPNGGQVTDLPTGSDAAALRSAASDDLFAVTRPEGVSVDDWRRITADEQERLAWLLDMARRARRAYDESIEDGGS